MKRFYAKVGEKIEQFDELPYRTYFMYGQDGEEYIGRAMLLYTDHNGGRVLTPIFKNSGEHYKRPEYAGLNLSEIKDYKD